MISLGVNAFFIIVGRLFLKRSMLAWFLISLPSFIIEFWFERVARPTYADQGNGMELKRAGEDLDAKGLTEWMWDIVYWTWGVIALAAVFGKWAWYLALVIPVYSAWLAWTTYTGARSGLSGMADSREDGAPAAQSKRQAKMEKRGGQRMQYR